MTARTCSLSLLYSRSFAEARVSLQLCTPAFPRILFFIIFSQYVMCLAYVRACTCVPPLLPTISEPHSRQWVLVAALLRSMNPKPLLAAVSSRQWVLVAALLRSMNPKPLCLNPCWLRSTLPGAAVSWAYGFGFRVSGSWFRVDSTRCRSLLGKVNVCCGVGTGGPRCACTCRRQGEREKEEEGEGSERGGEGEVYSARPLAAICVRTHKHARTYTYTLNNALENNGVLLSFCTWEMGLRVRE